jgi:phosphatidylserine/phosphatidylglycerophosphate/cardiolipin synthase-like enzyme
LSRLRLLEKAEKSGDLQYFLMKGDTAGDVMLHAMLKAADRGVRVRWSFPVSKKSLPRQEASARWASG